jgi:hypothetical protein
MPNYVLVDAVMQAAFDLLTGRTKIVVVSDEVGDTHIVVRKRKEE